MLEKADARRFGVCKILVVDFILFYLVTIKLVISSREKESTVLITYNRKLSYSRSTARRTTLVTSCCVSRGMGARTVSNIAVKCFFVCYKSAKTCFLFLYVFIVVIFVGVKHPHTNMMHFSLANCD